MGESAEHDVAHFRQLRFSRRDEAIQSFAERADLIAWLATQNDSPVALPEPEAAPAEEAAAEGDAAETTATE